MTAKPFVNWAGGKSRLLKEIIPRFPSSFGKYHEPFLGGGAVFFGAKIKGEAILSDICNELIECYRVVRDNPFELIKELNVIKYLKETHDERMFRQMKEYEPVCPIKKAARLIYLTKHCYRSIDPLNKKYMSQLLNRQYSKVFFNRDNILKCSNALTGKEIVCCRYDDDVGSSGDFFYFDPPYYNVSRNLYKNDMTSFDEHKDLASHLKALDDCGRKFMLSHSYNKEICELYKYYDIVKISAKYTMKDKGFTDEIIVRNY